MEKLTFLLNILKEKRQELQKKISFLEVYFSRTPIEKNKVLLLVRRKKKKLQMKITTKRKPNLKTFLNYR